MKFLLHPLEKEKMRALLRSLEDLNMPVLQIPSIEDISSGKPP